MTLDCWHDYEFRDVNWINWTLVAADYERAHYSGTSEIHVAAFGLHARLTWVHDAAQVKQFKADMDERLREIGIGEDA